MTQIGNWRILDSGADTCLAPVAEGPITDVNILVGTADKTQQLHIRQQSTTRIPSTTVKEGIKLNTLISPDVPRGILSVGEICDGGLTGKTKFEVLFRPEALGTSSVPPDKCVAEVIVVMLLKFYF